jgi:zinc protease
MREAVIRHFKGHPYGRDPLAELATLPAITRDDLLRFLRAHFVPSNMVVALSGDIGREEARASLAQLFQDLPAGSAPERQLAAPAPTPPGVALIHKPGQVQSKIVAVLPGIRRVDPEFWKLNLLMSVFGGSDSLMYTRLRDDLGIVYSAGFYPSTRWEAGLLVGVIGCKGDQAAEAVLETVRVMNRLQADVPAEDLEQKRLDALNSFVFNVDTKAELVRAYGRYTLRQEPLDTLERVQADYAAARRGELQGLAGRYLQPSRLQITIVADKTLPVRKADGVTLTLGENLKAMAVALGLPFEEVGLR